jgi:hypothetical protein
MARPCRLQLRQLKGLGEDVLRKNTPLSDLMVQMANKITEEIDAAATAAAAPVRRRRRAGGELSWPSGTIYGTTKVVGLHLIRGSNTPGFGAATLCILGIPPRSWKRGHSEPRPACGCACFRQGKAR